LPAAVRAEEPGSLMRLCLMIKARRRYLAAVARSRACEDVGLKGLFRSDHYMSVGRHTELGSRGGG
jgi:hypothetical protein